MKKLVNKKNWRHNIICTASYYEDLKKILVNPDAVMYGVMLKIDPTTTLALININNHNLVIKRYNIKNLWHGIKKAFVKTRAKKCWQNAYWLLKHGIATPKPIAVVEKRIGLIKRQAYFIYEYVQGTLVSDYFNHADVNEAQVKKIAQKIVAMLQKLAAANICHKDMKATNIILVQGEPYFIDLDSMCFNNKRSKKAVVSQRDIKRFLANWDDCIKVKKLFEELLFYTYPAANGGYIARGDS